MHRATSINRLADLPISLRTLEKRRPRSMSYVVDQFLLTTTHNKEQLLLFCGKINFFIFLLTKYNTSEFTAVGQTMVDITLSATTFHHPHTQSEHHYNLGHIIRKPPLWANYQLFSVENGFAVSATFEVSVC